MSDQHSEAPSAPAPPRPPFPGRTRATWFLVAASLLPGVLAAVAPELWHGLPYAFRVTVYVLCGLMMATVVALILTHKEGA
jgi:xanthine/uracil permease